MTCLRGKTAAELAEDTWDVLTELEFIDDDFNVYDGAHVSDDCEDVNNLQFSFNAALALEGSAYLYNYVCLATADFIVPIA